MITRTVHLKERGALVCSESKKPLSPPSGWVLLPPGDAALTRRVKAEGPHWVVEDHSKRRVRSRGVWAPAERIDRHRQALERERATPAYARKLKASRDRRAEQHLDYVEDFRGAVLEFLAFSPTYATLGAALASAVTEHTTPVGSGTVGRTKRIPLEERAAAAVIAWLRHQTTGYDDMEIARVKGRRRQVRRRLAQRSRELLQSFRRGDPVAPKTCPLHRALGLSSAATKPSGTSSSAPPAKPRRKRLLAAPTAAAAPAAPAEARPMQEPLADSRPSQVPPPQAPPAQAPPAQGPPPQGPPGSPRPAGTPGQARPQPAPQAKRKLRSWERPLLRKRPR